MNDNFINNNGNEQTNLYNNPQYPNTIPNNNNMNFNTNINNNYTQPLPNNENINKPNHNKKIIYIVIIMAIVAVIAFLIFINMDKKDSKKDDTPNKEQTSEDADAEKPKEEETKEVETKTYSKATSTDNFAIPFNATTNGYYALDLKGEKFGQQLKREESSFKNDALKITHYYRTQFVDSSITIENLWGLDSVVIQSGYTSLPKDSKLIDYEIISNQNNIYLIKDTWNNSTSSSYSIYIGNSTNDYYFKADTTYGNLEDYKLLYNNLVKNSDVCYINFDEEDNWLSSTKSINDSVTVDTSTWRFLPDMIKEYYESKELKYISSIKTDNFNHQRNYEVTIFPVFAVDSKKYTAGFTITSMQQKNYENAVKNLEKINVKAFKEVYYKNSKYNLDFYIKTKNYYYYISTGLSKNYDASKLEIILNQIFY